MSTARYAAALARVDPGPGYGREYPLTADTELTAPQDGGVVTNDGAPSGIIVTFPEAVPGMEFALSPRGTYSIVVKANGLNTIVGLPAGARYALPRNSFIVFGCSSAGQWKVVIGERVATPKRIDLESFVSAYAEPGESVVFSSDDWATSYPGQTQRRKNFRIMIEAALKANGGTGEHDGEGWYTTNEATMRSDLGELFIRGPLVHEPYDDGQYAPFFATADTTQKGATTRGWTMPAVRLIGTGGTIAYNATTGVIGNSASRLIGYGAPGLQWYPGAGPANTGIGRHLSYVGAQGIGVARIGDTGVASVANPVLRIANFYDTVASAITGVCSYWKFDDVVIDLEPPSSYAQVGALIQCGLDCQVPGLRIMGHGNTGWCMVVSGTFNGTAKVAPTTTIMFGDVMFFGSKRGVVFTYANCFVDLIDLEPSGLSTSKQQLILGDGVASGRIGYLWAEECRLPDGATASGADAAIVVVGGIDSEWNPSYGVGTYDKPGPLTIEGLYLTGKSGSAPTYAIMAKSCSDLYLGRIIAGTFGTAVLRLQPGTVTVADDPAYLRGSYDSRTAQWNGVANFLSDGTDYAYSGTVACSGVVDRAIGGAGRAPAKPNRSSSHNAVGVLGEMIMNTALVPGGPIGWACTTAGAYPTTAYTPVGQTILQGSKTYDPANLVAGAAPVSTTVTVTGAAVGDRARATFSLDLQLVRVDAYVSAANTVTVTLQNINTGGADVNLGSGTLTAFVEKA